MRLAQWEGETEGNREKGEGGRDGKGRKGRGRGENGRDEEDRGGYRGEVWEGWWRGRRGLKG